MLNRPKGQKLETELTSTFLQLMFFHSDMFLIVMKEKQGENDLELDAISCFSPCTLPLFTIAFNWLKATLVSGKNDA